MKKKINRVIELFKCGIKNREDKILNNMVGFEKIEEIHSMISKFGMYENAVILITGESGTGKQLVAENIHLAGSGNAHNFLSFNCCAVPDALAESILFGYKKGAFTGAAHDSEGLFQRAGQGTVFLDEIGSSSLNFQLKLLHVLETGEFFSLGDFVPKTCNARIILATNENIEKAVQEGRFRKDLYYRINNLNINLPPLKELKKNIPLLVGYLLNILYKKHNIYRPVSPEIIKACEKNEWDGNIRELRGILEKCLLLSDSNEPITAELFYKYYNPLSSGNKDKLSDATLKEKVENYEKGLIKDALNKCKTQKQAANLLRLTEATLSEKVKKYNLR